MSDFPTEAIDFINEIDQIIEALNNNTATTNHCDILVKAREPLIDLKTTLGVYDDHYRRISSNLGDAALTNVIDALAVLIDSLKEKEAGIMSSGASRVVMQSDDRAFISAIRSTLVDAWSTVLYVEKLDTTDEFNNNRLAPAREQIKSFINRFNGFEPNNAQGLTTRGCCYRLKVDPDFLTLEQELYRRCDTPQGWQSYIEHFPYGEHADEITEKIDAEQKQKRKKKRIIAICIATGVIALIAAAYFYHVHLQSQEFKEAEAKGVMELYDFANRYAGSELGNKAEERLKEITDSLYKVAEKENTLEGWLKYQKSVPENYYWDSDKKIKELAFATEEAAWKYCNTLNTSDAYNEYLDHYPEGKHETEATKFVVNEQLNRINDKEYDELPELPQIIRGDVPFSLIDITNGTSYELTVLFASDKKCKRIVIVSGGSEEFELPNGTYRSAIISSDSDIKPACGTVTLTGGAYGVEYTIEEEGAYNINRMLDRYRHKIPKSL